MKRQLATAFAMVAIGVGSGIQCASAQSADADVCVGSGPQTPRDINDKRGSNNLPVPAKPVAELNLCNIHFHANAEHKSTDKKLGFWQVAEKGQNGFQCSGDMAKKKLTPAELKDPGHGACHEIKPGDTIEVHWVYTSCNSAPGEGLATCVACKDHILRVEAQTFIVVNNNKAMNFTNFAYAGQKNGKHQVNALPAGTGTPVVFAGSTTGPDYTQKVCSPEKVTWSVRPQCAKVDINSLNKWCATDKFVKDHEPHGARPLVTSVKLLAPIP